MSEISKVEKIETEEASNGNTYYRVKTEQLKYPTISWSIPDEMEEGSRIKYDINKDGDSWHLESIVVLDDQKNIMEDAQNSSSSEAHEGSGGTSSFKTEKNTRIITQVAFKKAVDQTQADPHNEEELAQHFDQVKALTNGYVNLMEELINEKTGEIQ